MKSKMYSQSAKGIMSVLRGHSWLVFITGLICIVTLPHTSSAADPTSQTVAPSEQLTNQDVHEIISMLGGETGSPKSAGDSRASASAPVPVVRPPSLAGRQGIPAATPSAPTQAELVQSLTLLNSLLNSGGISADTASLLGLGSLVPSTTSTSTSTTTENPPKLNANDAAAAEILNQLLSAAGSASGAAPGTPAADAAALNALLGLANAASGQQTGSQAQNNQNQGNAGKQSAQDIQNAALLNNLLLSTAAQGQPAAGAAAPGVKQQDFQSFQNAGLNLDSSSSNQLNGALGLLGALSSFASPQQPSLLNLGGGQNLNLLSGLLNAGGAGQKQNPQANLLATLFNAGQQGGQAQQRPGLLSSLGNLAAVVGGTLSGARGDGKPRVRGVDTRLGLGYRFGENADAQVVWEIGPQLFTEPLTDEQKQQLLLQQQQQRLQQQQQHINRRLHVVQQQQQQQHQQHLKQQQQQQMPVRISTLTNKQHLSQPPPSFIKQQLEKQLQNQLQKHKQSIHNQQLIESSFARRNSANGGNPDLESSMPKFYNLQQQQQQHQHQQQLQANQNYNQQLRISELFQNLNSAPQPSVATLQQIMQPPQYSTRLLSPVAILQNTSPAIRRENYYAKKEANPSPQDAHSQLTDYERWLLLNQNENQNSNLNQNQNSNLNSKRNQIHQQHLVVNAKPNPNAKKLDSFIFSKDGAENIVRVRIQPRENPHKVQITQSVSNTINKRIGLGYPLPSIAQTPLYGDYSGSGSGNSETGYFSSDDSYARRNALVYNQKVREIELQNEREQHLQSVGMQQRLQKNNQEFNFNQRADTTASPSDRRSSILAHAQTLSEWNDKYSMMDLVQNYVLTGLQSKGNNLVKSFFRARDQEQKEKKLEGASAHAHAQTTPTQPSPKSSKHEVGSPTTAETPSPSPGLLSGLSINTIKGMLGISKGNGHQKSKVMRPTTPRPVIKVGDHVSYDDLQLMITGGKRVHGSGDKVIPVLKDISEGEVVGDVDIRSGNIPTPGPEIFIDLMNGEVSMRKPFGTMDSFEPTTEAPENLAEDSPKHVFKILRQQLHEEYERVKLEQLKEAAKQRRKENIALGLSNPQDPLYLASKYFDLTEQERHKRDLTPLRRA